MVFTVQYDNCQKQNKTEQNRTKNTHERKTKMDNVTTKTPIHRERGKKKQLQIEDGDHGVNVIGSSVQNREGIAFFKALSNDVSGRRVSVG